MADTMLSQNLDSNNQKGNDLGEDSDMGPPTLHEYEYSSQSTPNDQSDCSLASSLNDKSPVAPVLSAIVAPIIDAEDVLRSPPKLLPAVTVTKRKSDESSKTSFKPLVGSMKNTSASLSIIEAPSTNATKSTRSTRSSIDPGFAAKQRSFLNKVHNALSSVVHDDTSCESDQEAAPEETDLSDDRSPEYMPGLDSVPRRSKMTLQNGLRKRRRDDSPVTKGKTCIGSSQEVNSNSNVIDDMKASEPSPPKKKLIVKENGDEKVTDIFCWMCHREDANVGCATCPRAYHNQCVRRPAMSQPESEWVCMECVNIIKAENQETRSKALKMLSLDQLCKLLLFAVERMKYCVAADVFEGPVDLTQFPTYADYIVNPMYLSLLEKNIKKKMYGSTEAFVADASWIVHNCIIFNSSKNILRVCKQEMAEIENCPDCYNYAYTSDENWFIQVCQKPHVLVWAKLKGFPYWPAKAMRYQSDTIDVRFFGAHDRAWVPSRDCYAYSEENPNPNAPNKLPSTQPQQRKKNPRNNLDACIEEVEAHIQLLKQKFLTFKYAPPKTVVHHRNLDGHLKYMLPEYKFTDVSAITPPKIPLLKRPSFELKSTPVSATSVKRMKADSSSPHPNSFGHTLKSSLEKANNISAGGAGVVAKEENCDLAKDDKCVRDDTIISRNSDVAVAKDNGASLSDLQKNGVFTPKENGEALEDKKNSSAFPLTLHTVTPGESQTFITSLTSPEMTMTSIAELRLKKKDARKGLVDRLQEKLAQWVSKPQNPVEVDNSSSKQSTEETAIKKHESDAEESGNADVFCNKSPREDVKRDLFAGAKTVSKESVNKILQDFNISKDQPKLVLKKLVLQNVVFPEDSLENVASQPMKTLGTSLVGMETELANDTIKPASNVKKIQVTEIKLFPEDAGTKNEVLPVTENVVKSTSTAAKLSLESVDSVTFTTCSSAATTSSVKSVFVPAVNATQKLRPKLAPVGSKATPLSVKPGAKSKSEPTDKGSVKILSKELHPKPKLSQGNITKLALVPSVTLTISKSAGANDILAVQSVLAAGQSPVQTKEEPISDEEIQPKCEENISDEEQILNPANKLFKSFATKIDCSADKAGISAQAEEIELSAQKKSSACEVKVVSKPFVIRARPISELKDEPKVSPTLVKNHNKPKFCEEPSSCPSEESCSAGGNDEDLKNDNSENILAVKSLMAKNVTVRLESVPKKNVTSTVEGEKPVVVPSSSEKIVSTSQSTPQNSLNTMATSPVVQTEGSVKKADSPPKYTLSSRPGLSPSQRLTHGATSILKVNKSISPTEGNMPVTSKSSEEVVLLPPPRTLMKGNVSSASSTSKASVVKTPLIRIVPKASSSVTSKVSSGASSQTTSKPASTCSVAHVIVGSVNTPNTVDKQPKLMTAKPGLVSLLTSSASSANGSNSKVAAPQGYRVLAEGKGMVKITPPRATVGPLRPSCTSECVTKSTVTPSLRAMPMLSSASTSPATVHSVQAKAGQLSSELKTTASTQSRMSTSCEVPKLATCKGPVSRELRSQANKMTEVFMGCLENCLGEMSGMGNLESQIRLLQLEMERMQWQHQQEIDELRHNTELVVSEIRDRMKMESQHAINTVLANANKEKELAISVTKERQWCAFCKKEAMFYCCWNTSYCDYQCQQDHWPVHTLTCTQNTNSMDVENQASLGNGHTKPASVRRIVISPNKVASPPLLKKH